MRGVCVLVGILLLVLAMPHRGYSVDPESSARQMGILVENAYGSESLLRENIFSPATSSSTPMLSLNRRTSFNAQLTCPSSNSFLRVGAIVGSTADTDITVEQDTDFDGIYDYTLAVNGISGVCADGFIICQAGTWNGCVYYKWLADTTSLNIGYVGVADIRYLKSCYCINQSCDSRSTLDLSGILQDLGGGVVGALQKVHDKYAVSSVKIQNGAIFYYGQDTANCEGLLKTGNSGLATYYYSPTALSSAVDTTVATESADPTSPYFLVTNSAASTGITREYVNCVVRRNVTATPDPLTISNSGTGSLCITDYILARVDAVQGRYLFRYLEADSTMNPAHNLCGHTDGGGLEGWHEITSVNVTEDPSRVSFTFCLTPQATDCSFTPMETCVTAPDYTFMMTSSCTSGYPATGQFSWHYTVEIKKDLIEETIDDTCTTYENNPDCSLQEETVDGIVTYTHGQPTSSTPAPSCKTITGSIDNTVCRDWWEKRRTYFCRVDTNYNLSSLTERADLVADSTNYDPTGGAFSYTDLKPDGTTTDVSGELPRRLQTAFGDCTAACKVRRPMKDTRASTSGTTSFYLSSLDSYEIVYKRCTVEGVCPTTGNEEIVIDCTCIDDFGDAATAMEILDAARRDIICSGQ